MRAWSATPAAPVSWKASLPNGFEASPDAREWVLKLRDGIKFHDGEALDLGGRA